MYGVGEIKNVGKYVFIRKLDRLGLGSDYFFYIITLVIFIELVFDICIHIQTQK